VGLPRVAAIIVTWNRRAAVDVVLGALSRQEFPVSRLDVVVVDNGSGDGTVEWLAERWRPDRIVENPTAEADRPAFREEGRREGGSPFASLTIIRNRHNLGGCGGFNTGLAYLEAALERGPGGELGYAWLVDDDVDLPPTALKQLVKTAEGDESIGLVGSRTVDFDDRRTTIETTIYFDYTHGWMGPEPIEGHPRRAEHLKWVEGVGGTRGLLPFTGVRDVDVVSASSLLARWSAVKKVGFWDRRYFIYCDDADWSLRFGKAGYRVVCDLDAVVYHTYWLTKLTPVRGYYAERNLIWLMEKALPREKVRKGVARRLGSLLLQSRKAMTHCRLFHAEIIRRTADDVATGRGGKLDYEGPPSRPVMEILEEVGALRAGARVVVMCSHPESIAWAEDLRRRVTYALIDRDRAADRPRWIYLVREGVHDPAPEPGAAAPGDRAERIVFRPNKKSKWESQKALFREPAEAVVVFDQLNDFPLIKSRANIHIDRRRAGVAQLEADGLKLRAAFLWRWIGTAARCGWYVLRVRPRAHAGKYG
jgi:GT2 family glycosyltransferase